MNIARLVLPFLVLLTWVASHAAQGGGISLPPDQLAIVRKAAPTTTGTQSFTSSRIDEFDSAIFLVSGADSDGSAEDSAMISVGFFDDGVTGTGTFDESVMGRLAVHGNTNAQEVEYSGTVGDVISIFNGTTWAQAHVSTIHTNGITITWTSAPDKPYRITCILIGGDGQSYSNQFSSSTSSSNVPFLADIIFFSGKRQSFNSTDNKFEYSFGFAARVGDSIEQGSSGCSFPDAVNPTESYGVISNTKSVYIPLQSGSASLAVTGITSSNFSYTASGTLSGAFLAVDLSEYQATVVATELTTGTGQKPVCTGDISPVFGISVANAIETLDSPASDHTAGSAAISAYYSSKESSLSWSNTDDAALTPGPPPVITFCKSYSESTALALIDDGGVVIQEASLYSLGSASGCSPGNGFTFDFTTASAAGQLVTLAIGLEAP